ncbi:sentrin-specific protease 1 [Striga asiatica]|uniref:Sentrin-specific protease 1 n=1 Tax=Striga asiatica TaxID=4170 RepID=A0A5A7QAX3_STRAF|nr:sentrin-specific protease 1 [Striga asiatica]
MNDTPGVIGGLDIGIRGNQNVDDLVSVVDIPFEKIKRVKKRQVICKSCPFDTDFWDTMRFDLTSDLIEWLKVGKLKNRRKKNEGFVYYDKKNTILSPPFDFNVDVVSDKNWFFTLYESNCFLDGSIGLYALELPSQKFTTTDNFFDQQMKSLYSLYIVNSCDPRICTIDNVIVDYMFGFKILCGESWLDVDYVLFPIHVELEGVGHWILGRLSFATRTLMIYNSYRSTDFDQVAENDPLDVIFVEDLPQQLFCDCGVFVASFAEYIVSNEPINAATFDVDIERSRFSYLLYTHGKLKQEKDSESDDDSPGPLPANYRNYVDKLNSGVSPFGHGVLWNMLDMF